MASKKFFVDIDLGRNQLLKTVLETGDTSTIDGILTTAGQIGFDSTTKQFKYNDGDTVNYLLDSENWTTDFSGNTANDLKMASIKAIFDYYVSNDIGEGAAVIGINDAENYFTATEVEGALQEIGLALDTLDNSMSVVGSITATGDYPTGTINTGDAYLVVGGPFDIGPNTLTTSAGSLVVANAETPGVSADADWFILDTRREHAAEGIEGFLAIATQAIVNAGTDDTTAVTPLKLKAYITEMSGVTIYTEAAAAFTDGEIIVTHGLGDNVVSQVWLSGEDITSGVGVVSSTNTVTVSVNTDPGDVKVVVIGEATMPA